MESFDPSKLRVAEGLPPRSGLRSQIQASVDENPGVWIEYGPVPHKVAESLRSGFKHMSGTKTYKVRTRRTEDSPTDRMVYVRVEPF